MCPPTVSVRHQNLISWKFVAYLINGDEDRISIIRNTCLYTGTRAKNE
jgi:hypothetical protein